MSLLNYLQFQKIDDSSDDFSNSQTPDEDINLDEPIDENSLDKFWDQVVDDVHNDPSWFTFDDK